MDQKKRSHENKEEKKEMLEEDDDSGNMLQQFEEEFEDPQELDSMINQGNQVYEDYKQEIVAAKRAEAEKYRQMMEEQL